tara:strand:- start:1321 stop:1713 length:393 start_codon:yes stop_codon:yes gene_type:complete
MEGMNIRHFKLMNGEEIIGLVAVKNKDNYIVERPVRLNPSMLGGIQFSAWFPFSDAKQFKIRMSDIIQHVPVAETIKETYVQFALKMDKPVEAIQSKTDQELLQEYEERLANGMYDDEYPEDLDKKRTLH